MRVYETRVNNLDELKQRLIELWIGLQQKTLLTQLTASGGSDCELIFVHMGHITNIYCRTVENGLRKFI